MELFYVQVTPWFPIPVNFFEARNVIYETVQIRTSGMIRYIGLCRVSLRS